jgi:hypothetical protein
MSRTDLAREETKMVRIKRELKAFLGIFRWSRMGVVLVIIQAQAQPVSARLALCRCMSLAVGDKDTIHQLGT